MSEYTQRHLTVTFALGTGNFGNGGFNTVELTGLRASADIVKAGGTSQSELQLRIYGMTLDLMNKLSTLGKPLIDGRNNTVMVAASSGTGVASVAFQGTIYQSWADFQSMPDVPFIVSAYSGLLQSLQPAPPSSFPGPTDVATIMAGLATQMGLTFENNGVSVILASPYFPGTAYAQAQACAQHAGINMIIDDNVLAIWPKGGSRGGPVPLISPQTGLICYPAFTANGIVLETLYNPLIVYGAKVQVKSSLDPATGTWTIFKVAHNLESETPGGRWSTTMECSVFGHEVPVA